jgi:hypothetical protein
MRYVIVPDDENALIILQPGFDFRRPPSSAFHSSAMPGLSVKEMAANVRLLQRNLKRRKK